MAGRNSKKRTMRRGKIPSVNTSRRTRETSQSRNRVREASGLDGRYQKRYVKKIVDAIDAQINMELKASYIYQVMSSWFAQYHVALPGFKDYFLHQSTEERAHAQKFIDYQATRGYFVNYKDVKIPVVNSKSWKTPLDLLTQSLKLENMVTDHIYAINDLAVKEDEHQLIDWLGPWLEEQITGVKALQDLITNVKRVGMNEGIYMLDGNLQNKYGEKQTTTL